MQNRIRFIKQVLSGAVKVPHVRFIEDAGDIADESLVTISGTCWLCQRKVHRYFIKAGEFKRNGGGLVSCQVGGCSTHCRTRGESARRQP